MHMLSNVLTSDVDFLVFCIDAYVKKTWSKGIPWVKHGRVKESQILVRKARKGIGRG